jgi:2-dehydropantoate 2-reductase
MNKDIPVTTLLIVGTGALANLFGARLVQAGQPVVMLGTWAEGLQALQARGICVEETAGTSRCYPVRATQDPALCRGIQYALVLVKAWQTQRAASTLAQCLPAHGLALTLQNGWGNREVLQGSLGPERVALGVTTTGATLLAPGHVRPGGQGAIAIGRHPRLAALTRLLQRAGFEVAISDDVNALLWGKLVINAAINPLTSLLQVPNGELLVRPAARQLMAMAACEAAAVGQANGLSLPFADPVVAAEEVAKRTATNHSSMFQDVKRGAPTEINAICGAVVRTGQKLGIPTPVNQALELLVKAKAEIESRRISESADGQMSHLHEDC